MGRTSGLLCLWPGLHAAWHGASGTGLLTALLYSCVLDLLILFTYSTPVEGFDQAIQGLWAGFLVCWIVGGWWTRPRRVSSPPLEAEDDLDLFIRAQTEYLRGEWFEARRLLEQRLTRFAADLEAQLLLAAVYRHERRLDAARRCLVGLERLPGAEKWRLEIERERCALDELARESSAPSSMTDRSVSADPRMALSEEGPSDANPSETSLREAA